MAVEEDRARFHEIQYSESGEPVNDESLYKKTMRTSPMKHVEPSIRNEVSNMSHSAHLKGAKSNHLKIRYLEITLQLRQSQSMKKRH